MKRFLVSEDFVEKYQPVTGEKFLLKKELIYLDSGVVYLVEWHERKIFSVKKYGRLREIDKNLLSVIENLLKEELKWEV